MIAPALNSRLRHWLSDEDDARRSAGRRLSASLERLRAAGIEAEGLVGDADPLQAIADALHRFEVQRIVIATRPQGRSHWLARDLIGRARRRFAQPGLSVASAGTATAAISRAAVSPRNATTSSVPHAIKVGRGAQRA